MSYLDKLSSDLPEVCSETDLVKYFPDIFKSTRMVHRMRHRGETPTHFFLKSNRYFLKSEIISWLKSRDDSQQHL